MADTRRIPASSAGRGVAVLVAWALVAVPAAGQERVQGNVYSNSRYGIEVTKPPDWHFLTAGMVVDLAKKSAGGASLRGEDDPVKLAGFAVVLSKSPTLGGVVEPQVVVLVHELAERPANLIQACEGLRSGMSEPETVRPTRELRVGDRAAARLEFRGFVESASVRATALCAFRERQAFLVVAQALSADFDREAATFEAILSSVRLK